jgi:hypothetical protein
VSQFNPPEAIQIGVDDRHTSIADLARPFARCLNHGCLTLVEITDNLDRRDGASVCSMRMLGLPSAPRLSS